MVSLIFAEMARHAQLNDYHVSFATIPLDAWFVHMPTAELFKNHHNHLSLLIRTGMIMLLKSWHDPIRTKREYFATGAHAYCQVGKAFGRGSVEGDGPTSRRL